MRKPLWFQIITFFTAILILLIQSARCMAQSSGVSWSSFNIGFGASTSSNTAVQSVMGQAFVGTAEQGNTSVQGGFLANPIARGPVVTVAEDEPALPLAFSLSQNYPNPFNASTTIRFEIPHRAKVALHIYNVLGQQVAILINEEKEPGRYAVTWNGLSDEGVLVSTGLYFYRLRANDFIETKKVVLIK